MSILDSAQAYWLARDYSGTGNWLDGSGNGHDATAAGGVTFLTTNNGKQAIWFPGAASNSLSVPTSAALGITGNITVDVYAQPDTWDKTQVLAARYENSGTNRCWRFGTSGAGTGTFDWYWSEDGTTGPDVSMFSTTHDLTTEVKWIRVTLDVDGGTGGVGLASFYVSDDGEVWTLKGTEEGGSAPTSIFNDADEPLTVGVQGDGSTNPTTGYVHRVRVWDGIADVDGTLVLDIDPRQATEPYATFTALTGQTVTINRGAATGLVTTVVNMPLWLTTSTTGDDFTIADAGGDFDPGATDDFTCVIVFSPMGGGSIFGTAVAGNQGWIMTDTSNRPRLYIHDGVVSLSDIGGTPGAGRLWRVLTYFGRRNAQVDFEAGWIDHAVGTMYLGGGPTDDTTTQTLANANTVKLGARGGGGANCQGMYYGAAYYKSELTDAEIHAVAGEILSRNGYGEGRDILLMGVG